MMPWLHFFLHLSCGKWPRSLHTQHVKLGAKFRALCVTGCLFYIIQCVQFVPASAADRENEEAGQRASADESLHRKQGEVDFENRNFSSAEHHFLSALSANIKTKWKTQAEASLLSERRYELNKALAAVYQATKEKRKEFDALQQASFFASVSKHLDEAIELTRKRVQLAEELNDPDALSRALENYAQNLDRGHNYETCAKQYERAIDLRVKQFDPASFKSQHRQYVNTNDPADAYVSDLTSLGLVYTRLQNFDKATVLFQKHLELMENAFGPEGQETLTSLHNVAMSQQRARHSKVAEASIQRLIITQRKLLGNDSEQLIFSLNTLRKIYEDQDDDSQAEATAKEQLRIARLHAKENPVMVASVLEGLVEILRHEGKTAEASREEKEAEVIRTKSGTSPEHHVQATVINSPEQTEK